MSSDSVHKSSTNKNHWLKKNYRIIGIFIVILFLFLIGKGEIENDTQIFAQEEIARARNDVPAVCKPLLESFLITQRKAKLAKLTSSSFSQTIVFACHRKWCNSYGLCEPCSGIGDRTRHLLAGITEANRRNLSVELDYPQAYNGVDLRFREAFEYSDPWGLLSEWFHFRSYDVSKKELHLESWGGGKDGMNVIGDELEDQFVHFIPLHGSDNGVKFDPCLYHVLFSPTTRLQNEITYYSNIFRLDTGNVLGIHFRTGDSTAFGVPNKDVRAIGSSLDQNYDRMLECAENLATRLNIHRMDISGGDSKDGGEMEKFHFYLATDNQFIKDKARNEKKYVIHLTDDRPSAYLRAEGDRSAFLELYLLSKTRGLVINLLPKHYEGTGTRLSTFAELAKKVGFMSDEQIIPCSLD